MDPVSKLKDLIDEFGTSYLAQEIGCSRQLLYLIAKKKLKPSDKVLEYLGMKRETKYVKAN